MSCTFYVTAQQPSTFAGSLANALQLKCLKQASKRLNRLVVTLSNTVQCTTRTVLQAHWEQHAFGWVALGPNGAVPQCSAIHAIAFGWRVDRVHEMLGTLSHALRLVQHWFWPHAASCGRLQFKFTHQIKQPQQDACPTWYRMSRPTQPTCCCPGIHNAQSISLQASAL
jgi:hypothetical protein